MEQRCNLGISYINNAKSQPQGQRYFNITLLSIKIRVLNEFFFSFESILIKIFPDESVIPKMSKREYISLRCIRTSCCFQHLKLTVLKIKMSFFESRVVRCPSVNIRHLFLNHEGHFDLHRNNPKVHVLLTRCCSKISNTNRIQITLHHSTQYHTHAVQKRTYGQQKPRSVCAN